MYRLLVINPGSTSTKVAYFEDETEIWKESIEYDREKLSEFERILDQYDMRREDIHTCLQRRDVDPDKIDGVVGRGGPFKSLRSGTYRIDPSVLDDVRRGNVQAEHISNIGVLLAFAFSQEGKKPAFFVDPVSVDEFEPVARISGIPEIERKSLLHTLNIKAVSHKVARELGKTLEELNLIVAHLGGGISVCPIRRGRIIDVNNANEMGPFSPERSGGLPVTSLVELAFSKRYSEAELKKHLVGEGGIVAYLGTNDLKAVEGRISDGDEKAELIYRAMAYQISKEIGGMAAVLEGKVDGICLTGGLAHSTMLVGWIKAHVAFIAPVHIFAGENEMEALAMGALRILRGEEDVRTY